MVYLCVPIANTVPKKCIYSFKLELKLKWSITFEIKISKVHSVVDKMLSSPPLLAAHRLIPGDSAVMMTTMTTIIQWDRKKEAKRKWRRKMNRPHQHQAISAHCTVICKNYEALFPFQPTSPPHTTVCPKWMVNVLTFIENETFISNLELWMFNIVHKLRYQITCTHTSASASIGIH